MKRVAFPTVDTIEKRLRPIETVQQALDAFACKMNAMDPDDLLNNGCTGDLSEFTELDCDDCRSFFQSLPESYKIFMYGENTVAETNPIQVPRFVFGWEDMFEVIRPGRFIVKIK